MDCGGTNCQGSMCGCAAQAGNVPLHVYILLDQSLSMNDASVGGSKWDLIKGALDAFLGSADAAGIGVGIGYFPFVVPNPPPPCFGDGDCGSLGPCVGVVVPNPGVCQAADSCYSSNYAPDVPIGSLPGVRQSIVDSLDAHSPSGFTPTYPALAGTYPYVQSQAAAHPNDRTVVVLATDGNPTTCDSNTNNIAAIVANLVGPARNATPSIMTFVIGVGSSLTSLNQIAAAGGTGQAFLVDTAGADPGGQFLASMKAIQGAALNDCQSPIPAPAGGAADLSTVNVRFTPAGGSPVILPHLPDASDCTTTPDGWYYDGVPSPNRIFLCLDPCNQVRGGATVDFVLGCPTIR